MTTSPRTTSLQIPLSPDLTLTLTATGQGRPALVLHGGAGPGSVAGVVEHLATDHEVLLPTHPGFADTPRPPWFSSVADLAVGYLDLLEDRDARDVLVVGSSFGGWVAAEMAVRDRGHRIGRLVLMDAIGPEIPGFAPRPPGPPVSPATTAAGEDTGSPPPGAGRPAPRGPSPAVLELLAAYGGRSMTDPALLRRLGRVQVPTLVVWGEDDPVVSPGYGRAYAAAFPSGRFVAIAGAGHLPAQDAPEATSAVLDSFLLPAGAGGG